MYIYICIYIYIYACEPIAHVCVYDSTGNSLAILSSSQVGALMSEYLCATKAPQRPSLDAGLEFHDDSELDSDSGLEDVVSHS